jgi:hypothetical protein
LFLLFPFLFLNNGKTFAYYFVVRIPLMMVLRLFLIQSSVILSNVIVPEYELNSLLRGVDISKACGPDGISNRNIMICADDITSAFTYLVNPVATGIPCFLVFGFFLGGGQGQYFSDKPKNFSHKQKRFRTTTF